MYRVFAAVLAVAFCASITQAQTAQSPPSPSPSAIGAPFTLERALSLADGASPSLEVASAGVRAAGAARTVAGLRPNPSLVIESENIAGTGDYRGLRSSETTASLQLPIELGGKRSARVAVADSRSDRATIQAAIATADLRFRVAEAYIAAAAAEQRLAVTRDQARLATDAFKVTRTRVTAGAAPPIDQQRADVFRVNADVAEKKAVRDAEVARANLALLIGQRVTGPLDLAWFQSVAASNYGPQRPASAEGTLALAAARADLNTASAQVRLARAQRIPDVTISAGARRLAATNDTAAVIGVSVPLPLFNSGAVAVRQARAERDRADAERRLASLDVEERIASARADLGNAADSAQAAGGPVLTAAAEAARIARIGYTQGKFSQLDLLQAEQTLADTRAAYSNALADYHGAEARLARLTAPAPGSR